MIDDDPTIVIRNLLTTNWSTSRTAGVKPDVHTGWYDYGAGGAQVTVTDTSDFALGGGVTGQSAGTGDGGVVQVRAGQLLVNGWAGTRDDLRGLGTGGSDINPKQYAFQLGSEIHRIVQANAAATPAFIAIGADTIRSIADTDGPATVYRREVTVRYTYYDAAAQP